jgi:hypothetical protein
MTAAAQMMDDKTYHTWLLAAGCVCNLNLSVHLTKACIPNHVSSFEHRVHAHRYKLQPFKPIKCVVCIPTPSAHPVQPIDTNYSPPCPSDVLSASPRPQHTLCGTQQASQAMQ